jgi:hypothetical protein
MTITAPFSERLGETWLLERTFHAQLRNGREIGLGEHAEWMSGLFVDGTSYWLGPEQEGILTFGSPSF